MNNNVRAFVMAIVMAFAVVGSALIVAPTAKADQPSVEGTIIVTRVGIYAGDKAQTRANRVSPLLADGTKIRIVCETRGQTMTSDVLTSDVWEKTDQGWYLPNAFVKTGYDGRHPNLPDCNSGTSNSSTSSPATTPAESPRYEFKDVDVQRICRKGGGQVVDSYDWTNRYMLHCAKVLNGAGYSASSGKQSSTGVHGEVSAGTGGANGTAGASSEESHSSSRDISGSRTLEGIFSIMEDQMQSQCTADHPGSQLVHMDEHGSRGMGAKGWRCMVKA